MGYLFSCAETYIKDSHAFGRSVWDSAKSDVIFILSHPNGWGGIEQVVMRRAAAKAKLIPDTEEGHDRIRFVTEGEASFNFCATNGISGDAIKVECRSRSICLGLIPCRPGGTQLLSMLVGARLILPGTRLKAKIPSEWKKFSPQSVRFLSHLALPLVTQGHRSFAWSHHRHKEGSRIYPRYGINLRCIRFLIPRVDRLKFSRFDNADIINHITQCFDESTKRLFNSSDEVSYIPFGSPLETAANLGISRGKMKLSGSVPAIS